MGYVVLRYQLQMRKTPLRVVAKEVNIPINDMYTLTSKTGTIRLTDEQINTIYEQFFKDGKRSKEEIFKYEYIDSYLE